MPMIPGATDRLFLRFCRGGDTTALGKVFDRTAPELLRVALYLCGNRADAEDLLQRTFLQAIESRASYDQRRRAVPWLLGILANFAKRLLRERAQRLAAVPPAAACDPAQEAAAAELTAAIARLRAELGEPYANVLQLHLEQGLQAKEIAERLGRPAGTVRTQLVRALALLRKRLPSGFVAAFAPLLPDAAVLATVKATVITAANSALPVSVAAAGATSTVVIGGALAIYNLLFAVPLLLIILGLALTSTWTRPPLTGVASVDNPRSVVADPATAAATSRAAPSVAATLPLQRDAVPTADVAAPAPRPAVLRVQLVWERTGAPAAGVGVSIVDPGEGLPQRTDAVTDAQGITPPVELAAGRWHVRPSHRSKGIVVDLAAGDCRTLELDVEQRGFANGLVVDADGRPVAGADVWMSPSGEWDIQHVVARSGDDGAFRVPLFGRQQLGARMAGQAPSLAVVLESNRELPAQILLRLRGPGGAVRGTVRDARGAPVPRARVLVGKTTIRSNSDQPFELDQPEPCCEQIVTGADGTFALASVLPGTVEVVVWARGYGPSWQSVAVPASTAAAIDVLLQDGATLAGQVRDARGQPVSAATITHPQRDRWCRSTTSDAAGRYLLEDLAAGEVVFTARCSAFDGPDNATTTVQLFPGRRTQWDPVLLPPRVQTIHGRLLRPDGRPANTLLVVRAPGGGETKYLVSTGPAGRFLLQHASSDPLVAVLGQDREVPLDSDGDNVIQLTRDELPTTMLRGRVITEDGAPVEAGVTLTGAENAPATARTTGDGSFGIGPLPSGRDCLHIRTRSAGDLTLPLRLPADNVLDLGDIVVRSPGGLELAVRDPRGLPASAFVMLCDPAGNVISSRSTNDTLQLEAVQPGHLVVQADGGDLLATAEIEVQSGVRTLSTLQLHAVTTAELHFRGGGERVTVFARSGDGAFAGLFDSQRQSPLRHVNAPPSYGVCTLQLPPGRFRLDCNSTDGRHGEVELLVRSLDDHPEVEVVLRKR